MGGKNGGRAAGLDGVSMDMYKVCMEKELKEPDEAAATKGAPADGAKYEKDAGTGGDGQKLFADTLLGIINGMVVDGKYPDGTQTKVIVPLRKKVKPEIENNVRPIALECDIVKMAHGMKFKRVQRVAEKYQILSENQYGFAYG